LSGEWRPASGESNRAPLATPKITDFGLAKRLDAEKGHTQSGSIVGTPSYMAPEQAGGKTSAIGPAADTYALGAILYELLTGRPPFRAETPLDTVLQVLSEDPVPPSRLQPKLPRDLETICLKCLHKEPAKRYATAAALGEDLKRFLEDRPIVARPTSWLDRGWRWCKRNRAVAASLLAVAVALLAGSVASSWFAIQSQLNAEQASRKADEADQSAGAARLAEAHATARETEARQLAASLQWSRYGIQITEARQSLERGQILQVLDRLQEVRPRNREEKDLRGFEWQYLDRLCHLEVCTFRNHDGLCYEAAFSPDGQRVASVGLGGRDAERTLVEPARVKVWDTFTGKELFRCQEGHKSDLTSVAFSSDGKLLASGGGPALAPLRPGEVKLWDAATGKLLRSLDGHTHTVFSVVFSPDDRFLASADLSGSIRLWEVATGNLVREFKKQTAGIRRLAFNPDGSRLASASFKVDVKIWDTGSGECLQTLQGHSGMVLGIAFHPNGRLLASGGDDKLIRLWNVDTGKEVRTISGHTGIVSTVAFTRDGKRLASAGADPVVRLWDWQTGQELRSYRGRANGINSIAYSKDGRFLAAASSDGAVTVWETAVDPWGVQRFPGCTSVAFAPKKGGFTLGRLNGSLSVWQEGAQKEPLTLKGHAKEVDGLAFSPDGRWLASGSDDRTVKIWDLAGRRMSRTLEGHTDEVLRVAFSADSRVLVSAGKDKTARLWDVASGKLLQILKGEQTGPIGCARFSPDGRTVITCGPEDPSIHFWDPASGKHIRTLHGNSRGVLGAAFSPDGSRLAAGGLDGALRVWNLTTGEEIHGVRGDWNVIGGVAFSPDGQRLAAGTGRINSGEAGKLRLWDVETGQLLLELPGEKELFINLCFSPDGHRLAAESTSQTVHVWEAGGELLPDTSQWKLLFADNLAGTGERWAHQTSWSVRDGWLSGQLHKAAYQKLNVTYAGTTAKLVLPPTVEVRFDCWISAEANIFAIFDRPGANQAVQAWLLGEPQQFGHRGARLACQGGLLHYPALTGNSHLEVKPGTPYQVRILRQPKRLTLFVNGVEVVTADVPLVETPTLTLGAMSGAAGTEVRLTNVEIRAPAEIGPTKSP
jgi:WD40 repeat protein